MRKDLGPCDCEVLSPPSGYLGSFAVDQIAMDGPGVRISARTTSVEAACPARGTASADRHGRYRCTM